MDDLTSRFLDTFTSIEKHLRRTLNTTAWHPLKPIITLEIHTSVLVSHVGMPWGEESHRHEPLA
jgi:hypothetical protein